MLYTPATYAHGQTHRRLLMARHQPSIIDRVGGLVFEDKTPHRHGLLARIRAIKRCDSLVQLDGIHTHRILRQRGRCDRAQAQETAIRRTSEAFIGLYAVLGAGLGLCSSRRCVIMQPHDLARTSGRGGHQGRLGSRPRADDVPCGWNAPQNEGL